MKSLDKASFSVICRARYFTMVEMLGVTAIIAILIGLVFGSYRALQIREDNIRAEAAVNSVHTALQAFKTKYGYYPQTSGDPMAMIICKGLKNTNQSQSVNFPNYYIKGGYLVLGKDFIDFLTTDIIKNFTQIAGIADKADIYVLTDGMEEPVTNSSDLKNINDQASTRPERRVPALYYRCPGVNNPLTYDLFSAGRDREFGTKDDIWPKNLRKSK